MIDIENKNYGTPNQILYQIDEFITMVHIEKMMELGKFVIKGHQFSRKDRKKSKL